MASSVAILVVVTVLVIGSLLVQPSAAATACRDCASSCSSVNFATPTGPCSGACSPEPQCLQTCKPAALAKCTSACRSSCNGSCWSGKCNCDRVCSDACAGAGSECNSSCINSQSCQSCKDMYTQQCTTYCNASCI